MPEIIERLSQTGVGPVASFHASWPCTVSCKDIMRIKLNLVEFDRRPLEWNESER